jgi:hypothetical protein
VLERGEILEDAPKSKRDRLVGLEASIRIGGALKKNAVVPDALFGLRLQPPPLRERGKTALQYRQVAAIYTGCFVWMGYYPADSIQLRSPTITHQTLQPCTRSHNDYRYAFHLIAGHDRGADAAFRQISGSRARIRSRRRYVHIWMQVIPLALPASIFATMIVSSASKTKIAFCMSTSLGRLAPASRR